jgi:hypothetical protein
MKLKKCVLVFICVFLLAMMLLCCGKPEFTVGGTVSGLTATGLVLSLNGEQSIELSPGAAEFLFEPMLRNGDAYEVTVERQPGSGALTAEITGGSGVIDAVSADDVEIFCTLDDTVLFTDSGVALEPCKEGDALFFDCDNDGNTDLLITGDMGSLGASAMLYKNSGGLDFADGVSGGIPGLKKCATAAADIDGDGDTDLALTGAGDSSGRYSLICENNGSGLFTDTAAGLTAMEQGVAAFGDIDNDGDEDLFLSGTTDGSPSAGSVEVYTNNGSGGFSDSGNTFSAAISEYAGFADADGDGDSDLLYGGKASPTAITELYLNDGSGGFTAGSPSLDGASGGGGFFSADGDEYPDIYIFGMPISYVAAVYINDGEGNYSKLENNFAEVSNARADAADVDNDGDEDLIVAGRSTDSTVRTILYLNDGSGLFTPSGCVLTGVEGGSVDLGDADGDGDYDLLVAGTGESGGVSILYENKLN